MASTLKINIDAETNIISHCADNLRYHKTVNAAEDYFSVFRQNIIGYQQIFQFPRSPKKIVYADWTATGRAYGPIEEYIQQEIMPFMGNTHTGNTVTGSLMSKAYSKAKIIIKEHVNANTNDALIFCGSGTTAAINKLQRILGMRIPEQVSDLLMTGCAIQFDEALKPVVFITHMEHHSNQVSWLETIADVEIIGADPNGNVDLQNLRMLLEKYRHRSNKIAAVTACSNVTGIQTPYHEIAKLIHEYGGLCFVDFACSAPYININMHPEENGGHLDAIYFSPHKFLGGPGTPGVLIFNKKMYKSSIPDQPGGGTIVYSNPWGGHQYINDIEQREDGGTPPILQGIKAAMCIRLKEEMGVENILNREEEMRRIIFTGFAKIEKVEILQEHIKNRLGVISFIVKGAHHNLIVKILNDRFGIQLRGGCSCAGTYGHMLFDIDKAASNKIMNAIRAGDLSTKPGWVRLSVHPTMTNAEVDFIIDAIEWTANHFPELLNDYSYDPTSNEYFYKCVEVKKEIIVENWFNFNRWGQFVISKNPRLQL